MTAVEEAATVELVEEMEFEIPRKQLELSVKQIPPAPVRNVIPPVSRPPEVLSLQLEMKLKQQPAAAVSASVVEVEFRAEVKPVMQLVVAPKQIPPALKQISLVRVPPEQGSAALAIA